MPATAPSGKSPFADLIPQNRFQDLIPHRSVFADIPLQVVGGVRDAAQEMLNLTARGGAALERKFPLGSLEFGPGGIHYTRQLEKPELPEVAPPETKLGGLTRGVAEFATGMIPGMAASKLLKVGAGAEKLGTLLGGSEKFAKSLGLFAGTEAGAQIANQIAFDPYGQRLSNLVERFPSLQNPVTHYLASDPNDSEAEARFKVALEGAALGAAIPGILSVTRRLRASLRRAPESVSEGTGPRLVREGEPIGPTETLPPTEFPVENAKPEPFITTPPESPAGNINLEHLNAPDEVKSAITRTANEFSGQIDEARRGVVSEQQTSRLADELGMTPEKLLKRRKGEAFSAEEALAARRILNDSAADLAAKARGAVGGSDAALLAFRNALQRHAGIQAQVSGMTAEAGRALRQFRMAAGGQGEAVKSVIDSFGGRNNIEDLAKAVSTIDTPEGLNQFARNAAKATTKDKLLEAWINALLSGPQTHVVNALSNTLVAGWTLPEHLLAAGIGAFRGGADRVRFREVTSRAFGLIQGTRDGLRAAAKTFATEEPSDLLSKIDVAQPRAIPSLTLRKGAQKKTLFGVPIPFSGEVQLGGKQIRLPGRALQASDEFFKALGYRAELNARAMRDGLAKGLKGQALAQHVQQIVSNPPEAMSNAALANARYQTFTQPLGKFGQAVQSLAASHPAMRLVIPFIRTPTNIAKFAVERSPFGLMMKDVRNNLRAGGATRDIQLARIAFGTGVGAVVAQLAAEGHITGGGPSDPIARNALLDTGWQPYSVKIGDKYYSYSRLEPLGTILGISADLSEIAGEVPQGDAEEIAGRLVGSISKNLTSKTYLRGVSDLIEAIQDPDRYGDRYIQNLIGTLVPTGVAQVARTQDPVLRDARSIVDTLKSRIPGYSESLPARRNIWGEPIVLSGGVGPDIISPVYSSTDKHDPVSEEFARLNVRADLPGRNITITKGQKIELNPQQYSDYVEMSGKPAKAMLDRLVGQPGYDQLPDDAKRELFERVIRKTREAAKTRMLAEILRGQQ